MKEFNRYYEACDILKDKFLKELEVDPDDAYWMADDIGGVLSFADCFVDMNNIVDYFKYEYTSEGFRKWYDQRDVDKTIVNMKSFKQLRL